MPNGIVRRITIPSGTYDIADERLKTECIETMVEDVSSSWDNAYYPVCQSEDELDNPTASTRLWTSYLSLKRTSYQINGHNGNGMTIHLTGNSLYHNNAIDAYIRLNHDSVHPSNTSAVYYELPQHQGIILSSGDCFGEVDGASYGSVTTTTYWPCSYREGTLYAPISSSGGGGGDTVTGNNVTLATTASTFMTVNGSTNYTIKLPTNIPSSWLGTTNTKAATGNHNHGSLNESGIFINAAAHSNGDKLVLSRSTNSGIGQSDIALAANSGNNAGKFLRIDGTWAVPSGGGGGSSTLSGLDDTYISDERNGQILTYSSIDRKWKNWDNTHLHNSVSIEESDNISVTFDNGEYREYKIIDITSDRVSRPVITFAYRHSHDSDDVSYEPSGENYLLFVNSSARDKLLGFTAPSGGTLITPSDNPTVEGRSCLEVSIVHASASTYNYYILTYSDKLIMN